MPRNIIEVGPEVAPLEVFTGEDNSLRSVSIVTGVDVVGTQLSVDQLTSLVEYPYTEESVQLISPKDYEGVMSSDGHLIATNWEYVNFRTLSYGTPIRFYRGEKLMNKMYIKNVDRVSKIGYKLNSMSAIGILDTQKHRGGIYTGQTFETALAEIIDGAIEYTVAEEVKGLQVYGWLPYDTKRNNLHQLLFACGVMVAKDENGDPLFRFLSSKAAKQISESRIYMGGSVDYSSPASAIDVTEHSFFALETDKVVTVYDNTDGSETADHTFIVFRDAPLHDLAVTGTLVIEDSGVNWAVVTGTGILTGQKYTHSTRVITRYADNVADQMENVVTVADCTLVTVANSENVAKRVLAYYSSMKTVSTAIVVDGEKAGDMITGTDPYDEPISGFIASMESNVSSITKARCKIITGYTPTGQGNNYSRAAVLTGSGSWPIPEGVTEVKAVLVSGGEGGSSGGNGEAGSRASSSAHGTGGTGGVKGTGGRGGRVLSVVIDVSSLDALDYSCGEGGAGGVASETSGDSPVAGALGTDTVLGSFSTAQGQISSGGVVNLFTGAVYGLGGGEGVAGQTGGGPTEAGPSLSYQNITYTGGAKGSDVKGYATGVACGGWGGGAAAGSNGGRGYDGKTEPNHGNGFNTGGSGGTGGRGLDREDAQVFGQGGDGGHGGGGGGGGGSATGPSQYTWPGRGGTGGRGSTGGKGGAGCIILYY